MSDELTTTFAILMALLSFVMEALTTTAGQVIALAIGAWITFKVLKASRKKARIHSKTFKSADFQAVIHDDHVAFSGNKGQNWTLFNLDGCSKDVDYIFVNSTETVPDLSVSSGYMNSVGVFIWQTTTHKWGTFTGARQSPMRLVKIKEVHPYQYDFGIKTQADVTLLMDLPIGHDVDPFRTEDLRQVLPSNFIKFRTFRGTITETDTPAFFDWWNHHKDGALKHDMSAAQKRYSENEAKAIKDMKAKYPEAKYRSLVMKAGTYDPLGFCGLTAKDEMIVENFDTGVVKRGGVAGLVYYFKESSYLKDGCGIVSANGVSFSTNKAFSQRLNYLVMKAGIANPSW